MRALFFVLCCSFAIPIGAATSFVFPNAQGPYGVGLKVVDQYDETRSYQGAYDIVTGQATVDKEKHARPIQTLGWYPAKKSGKAMTYGDYLVLAASQDSFDRSPAEISRIAAATTRDSIGYQTSDQTTLLNGIKAATMHAIRDATPIDGPFPVLVYAPSDGGSAFENADLCEYLASQGYLVIASPTQGAHGHYMTDDLEGAEAEAADIRFLIGYANSLAQADTTRLAVIGYSWGGLANALAAAKDNRIKVLVDLDGSIRYFPDVVKSAGYLTPRTLTVPLLFLANKEEPIDSGKDVLPKSLINRLRYSDVYKVAMHPLSHGDFSSDTLRFFTSDDPTELPIAALSQGYGWMARYVLEFLNAELKDDLAGRTFLMGSPAANGVPHNVLSVQVQPHKATKVTLEIFAARLNQQHFTHATELYAELRKTDPLFKLSKEILESWGSALLDQDQCAAAVEVLSLETSLFPKDADAYAELAYAQLADNHRSMAIKNYRRAVRLTPGSADLRRLLKKLEAVAPPS